MMMIKYLICTVLLAHTALAAGQQQAFQIALGDFPLYEEIIQKLRDGTITDAESAAAQQWEQSNGWRMYKLNHRADAEHVFNGSQTASEENDEKAEYVDSSPPVLDWQKYQSENPSPECPEDGCTWPRPDIRYPCGNHECPSHSSSSWRKWLGWAPWPVLLTCAALSAIPETSTGNSGTSSDVNPPETSTSYSPFWPICTALAGGVWYNWDAITAWWNGDSRDSESDPTEAQPQADPQSGEDAQTSPRPSTQPSVGSPTQGTGTPIQRYPVHAGTSVQSSQSQSSSAAQGLPSSGQAKKLHADDSNFLLILAIVASVVLVAGAVAIYYCTRTPSDESEESC